MSYIAKGRTMLKNSSITVRISGELRSKLEVAAVGDRRTVSFVINDILETWARQQATTDAPNEPRLVPPPGRPRSDATRPKALMNAGPLLPWINQVVPTDATRIHMADIIDNARNSAHGDPAPGLELGVANALHGLGWTEWDEVQPDGTSMRVWTR